MITSKLLMHKDHNQHYGSFVVKLKDQNPFCEKMKKEVNFNAERELSIRILLLHFNIVAFIFYSVQLIYLL